MIRLEHLGAADGPPLASSAHDGETVRLGRAEHNEVVLEEPSVSAEHAAIVFTPDGWVLRDLYSTNGTRILRDGQRVDLASEPGREVVLRSGDVVELGAAESPVRLRVVLEEPEEAGQVVSVKRIEELHRAEREAARDQDLLRKLYEAQKAISAPVELDALVDAVAEQVFSLLPRATHVTVTLREEERDGRPRYVPVGTRAREGSGPGEPIPITRSVFRRVVAERAAVLAADAPKDMGETASLLAARIRSTLGLPLWQGEDILGVLQVDNRASTGVFRERDLEALGVLAQTASTAFANAMLVRRLRIAEERQRSENLYLRRREQARQPGTILGSSPAIRRVLEQIRKVADTRVTVLVEGETGVGKELVARALHEASHRRERLFVAQNCAAMPANLLESELFGHVKGAFTGASGDKKGLFELADGGTLFLDEVGEMPLELQAKLLRVLQEGEVRPVGATRSRRVDVRIVAATNRDLEEEVREGRFREDLFYRLRVFPIRVPPLRERPQDIPELARYFLERYAGEFGIEVAGFSQEALERMQAYDWPGNVRQLQNEVQRMVLSVEPGGFVLPEHLSERIAGARPAVGALPVGPLQGTLKEMVAAFEAEVLRRAIEEHGGNKSAAARALGITREGLYKKLKAHGIEL